MIKNNLGSNPLDLISHTQPNKTFQKFELKIFSLQTLEDIENNDKLQLEKKKVILQKYLSSEILKQKERKRFKKIIKFFTNLIFPNLIASFLTIAIIFIFKNKTLFYEKECNSKNLFIDLIFKSAIQIITQSLLYFLMGYYVFLKPIIMKNEKKTYFILFYFFIMIVVHILFSILIYWDNNVEKTLNLKDVYFIVFIFDMIIAFLYGFIVSLIIKIKFVEYAYNLMMTFIIMGLILLTHCTKSFLFIIVQNKLSLYSAGSALFRLFVFAYMQLFENLLFFCIKKLIQHNIDFKNTALIFIKYLVCEVICSSITNIVTKDMIFGESILSVVIYIYQIIVFYRKKNFIVFYISKFYNYFFNKNLNISKKETEINERNLAAGVINDILITIYLKLLIQFFSNKFLTPLGSSLQQKLNDCFLNINNNDHVKIENIFSALLINVLILCMSIVTDLLKKNKIILWKCISYPFLLKSYYDLFFFYVTDINIQFYSGLIFE